MKHAEKLLKLRSHHIEKLKEKINCGHTADEIYAETLIGYKLGSSVENEGLLRAFRRSRRTVESITFTDIGENEPDIICDSCLSPFCHDSIASRNNTSTGRKELLWELLEDPNFPFKYSPTIEPSAKFIGRQLAAIDAAWKRLQKT